MSDPVEPAPPAKARPSTAWLVFSSAFIGALVLPVVLLALFTVMISTDPTCRGGGSNGGCYIAVFAATICGVPLGFILGLVVGFVRSARRATPKNPGSE